MTWVRVSLRRSLLQIALGMAIVSGVALHERSAPGQTGGAGSASAVDLSGRIELPRLLDLASARKGVNIEYDFNALNGVSVELRLDVSITDDQLWSLTNQLLATRGFTSVHTTGTAGIGGADDPGPASVINIVKLSDAAGLARIERDLPLRTIAGYVSVWLQVRNRPVKDIADAVKVLLSKPGGSMQEVPGQATLIVSDLRPRVEQIIAIVQAMDDAGEGSVVESIEAQNLAATSLSAAVTAASIASGTMLARPLQGKVTATPDDKALVIVAPANEMPRWRELVAQFDRPSPVETRTYAPQSFALAEVADLVEQTAHDPRDPRGSGDRWRVIHDALGGMLIVTATPGEHEQVAAMIERLNGLPSEARRPVRAFAIRNRSVRDIVTALETMLAAGVLDANVTDMLNSAEGPASIASSQLQRSERDSGVGVLPTETTQPSTAAGRGRGQRSDLAKPRDGVQDAAALTITADEGTNTLVAVGEPRKLDQLEDLLRILDVRQPQVMVEVLVVSLSEGDTLDLGVELEKIEISGDTVITLSSLFGLLPRGATSPTGKGFSGLILNPGDFRILIRALQTINNGRALNMPRVLVNNNQQANLDAVVQQPFLSTNASDTVATTSFGGFEDAGTTITVKPQIAKGDHLVLEYSVSLSAFVGESSDPGIPPPRQQNNLQSVVTIPDGYTVVVGGIEVETKADALTQVPLIGDIPWIGEAFKSRSRSSSRSRFFVFIRPTVLRQEGFEDLKYLSDVAAVAAEVDDGFPEVQPRIIR